MPHATPAISTLPINNQVMRLLGGRATDLLSVGRDDSVVMENGL